MCVFQMIGGGEWPLLASVMNNIQQLNQSGYQFAFDIIFTGLMEKLNQIPNMEVCNPHMIGSFY